ncbi:MAG: hypothetical protein HYX93_03210 [Chloroflexi bacterium]|nr:hypothetical protein [Chloroflexota bacterium]
MDQDEGELRRIAYHLWEEEDLRRGNDLEGWFKAQGVWRDRQSMSPNQLQPSPARRRAPGTGLPRSRGRGNTS